MLFLSTLSLRRATRGILWVFVFYLYFYPRSPCGERPGAAVEAARPQPYFYPRSPCGERPALRACPGASPRISIHALLAESDPPAAASIPFCATFLSTLSLRRATPAAERLPRCRRNFYPRSPCGERPKVTAKSIKVSRFLSTLSLRRATTRRRRRKLH